MTRLLRGVALTVIAAPVGAQVPTNNCEELARLVAASLKTAPATLENAPEHDEASAVGADAPETL
jgi:hypothetical protein